MRWFLLSLLLTLNAWAAVEDVYPFTSLDDQTRFGALVQQYRCVVCQNQSLADSNAPLAIDLKNVIYQFVQEGKTDAELDAFLTDHYGDFIRLSPPFRGGLMVLWLLPFLLLSAVIAMLVLYLKKTYSGKSRGA